VDWTALRRKIRVLDDFLAGEWLHHPKIFGLATNLYWVSGGLTKMKETMKHYNEIGETGYTQNNFNALSYQRKRQYHPQHLNEFSDYEEEHRSVVSALTFENGRVDQVEERPPQISLSDAERSFSMQLDEVLESRETGDVVLFKVPTALGKTAALEGLEGVTIAAPTNDLKEEITERMDVKCASTPATPEFESDVIQERIDTLYKVGLGEAVSRLLQRISRGQVSEATREDELKAEEYLRDLRKTYALKDTVVTTHARAMHTDFQHDTMIFDEDPLDQILEVGEVKISDLFQLKQNLQQDLFGEKNPLEDVLMWLVKLNGSTYTETPTFDIDLEKLEDEILERDVDSNIFDFFQSDYCVLDKEDGDKLRFVSKRRIPDDKKIIIMSATAPVEIYRKIFGDRLDVVELTNVEREGEIIQHTKKSYSRSSLEGSVDEINDKVDGEPVITFKTFKNRIDGATEEMHFGNCEGYDTLKGKDIAVVGTPHINQTKYFLIAMALGEKVKTTDKSMKYEAIEHNGLRFKFMAFNRNKELQKIQLSLIESELVQAVGRARTLREDCTVNVYSNLPLSIADKYVY
jgi:hypothetical protein